MGRSPGGGHANTLQYSYLENPHGQRSLVGNSPWDCKESDTTKKFSLFIAHNNYFFKSLQCIYYNRRLLDKILFSCNLDNIYIFLNTGKEVFYILIYRFHFPNPYTIYLSQVISISMLTLYLI